MNNEKTLEEKLEERKMKEKIRDEFFEKLAVNLGFVGDKYYTAKEKLFASSQTIRGAEGGAGNPF
jgi:hypothetical protein